MEISDERLQELIGQWHEEGRGQFEASYPNLDYDSPCHQKRFVRKARYVCLDDGDSGAFVVDQTDGNVYRIKSRYGVPNRKKLVGNIDDIRGKHLHRNRWW
jgi:hypothetical protein